MNRVLRWSLSAYSRLIVLYPDDLRRDFGPELLEAFERDLTDDLSSHGVGGAIRVWRITLREMIRLGPPEWLHIPAVAVPLLAAAAAFVSESPLLILTIRRQGIHNPTQGDVTPSYALAAIAIAAAVSALTALVAVYQRKADRPISLAALAAFRRRSPEATEVIFDGSESVIQTLNLN
jgi:hypothetical protein